MSNEINKEKAWENQLRCEHELAYTNKLNRLLSKQSDVLAEVLRFYAEEAIVEDDGGEKAKQVLKDWYDLAV